MITHQNKCLPAYQRKSLPDMLFKLKTCIHGKYRRSCCIIQCQDDALSIACNRKNSRFRSRRRTRSIVQVIKQVLSYADPDNKVSLFPDKIACHEKQQKKTEQHPDSMEAKQETDSGIERQATETALQQTTFSGRFYPLRELKFQTR